MVGAGTQTAAVKLALRVDKTRLAMGGQANG